MDEWGPDSSRTAVMCAWIQIRSIIDSACLAENQSFYHATKMHWRRKIQLWWHPINIPISFSNHPFLFLFPTLTFIFLHLTSSLLYLSTPLCLSLWDAFFEQGNKGRRSIGWQTHRRRWGKLLWRERKREKGRHCCRKNTSTLVHSRQCFTGPTLLHYITQACRRSNSRNPNHRREVHERSSVCLWFLPPRSTACFWWKSRYAYPNIGDFGWWVEDQRLSALTKDSIMNSHTWPAMRWKCKWPGISKSATVSELDAIQNRCFTFIS